MTRQRLASITLGRQFPVIRGRGRSAVRTLFDRIGPVQSQSPRAPFLAVAARLPGVRYATVRDAFSEGDLVKASNLRGTVHSCRPGTVRRAGRDRQDGASS